MMWGMPEDPLQKITEQIIEIEKVLLECDLQGGGAGAKLPLIQNVIVALMDAADETPGSDHQTRVKLARLEYRMRRCREALHMRSILAE